MNRNQSLREKCPDTEFFWSIFFCIRTEFGDLLQNKGKYGPEKTPYLDTFHTVNTTKSKQISNAVFFLWQKTITFHNYNFGTKEI